METLFLPKKLQDINGRFLKFQQETKMHDDTGFFIRKKFIEYKNETWQIILSKIDEKYKISIPCPFDFSLYKNVPETSFKYLKDVIMFACNFKPIDDLKLSVYISKNNLYVVSLSKSFSMEIKFFNGEPLHDHGFYTKQDIMKLVQQSD